MIKLITTLFLCGILFIVNAQQFKNGALQINLDEDGKTFIKATFVNQTWLRYNWNNPGSSVFGIPEKETFDVGLRRTRFQLIGQLTPRVLFYSQYGINNYNYISTRKAGAFFHDALCEYAVVPSKLHLGGGLHAWSGPGRFSAPAVVSFLGVDAPLFEQTTNDATDQFLRKLGFYAKGQVSRIDYRFAVAKPMAIQNSPLYIKEPDLYSNFSTRPPHLQFQSYVYFQFFDKENNILPYMAGTYLGKKKILNLGFGNLFQQKAMWRRNANKDTIYENLNLIAFDVFSEIPLSKNKNAINFYLASFFNKMGKGYIRSVGPMSPTNTFYGNTGTFNGSGSAFPMIGSGTTLYGQAGYLFKDSLFKSHGTILFYASSQFSKYERFKDKMLVYEGGLSWLIKGNNAKVTLAYQSRPIFSSNLSGEGIELKSARRGMLVMQYQIAF